MSAGWTISRPPFVQAIISRIAEQHGTTPQAILGLNRHHVCQSRDVSAARRQIIRELALDRREFSTPTIGRWLNIHHTTVIYHVKGWKGWNRPKKPIQQPKSVPAPSFDYDAPDESGIWI